MLGPHAGPSHPARPGREPPLRALVRPAGRLVRAGPWADPEEDRSQQLADRRPQGQGAGADDRHLAARRNRIDALQSDITRLSARQQKLQTSLDAKRAELAVVQGKLRAERARLTRLRARLLVVRRALAQRLVELYKADAPDAITVVLESDGFADLLTRAEFMERVSRQDSKIMDIVADAKADAAATAKRLDELEKRQAKVAKHDRGPARRGLDRPRRPRRPPRPHPDRPRAQEPRCWPARATAATSSRTTSRRCRSSRRRSRPSSPATPGPLTAGPIKPGSGGLIWPVNGPITSPFCESRSWESCHPGIDIGVPAGTPIRAAAAGKVVLMQGEAASGGYGNFTCIQHGGLALHVLRAPVALRDLDGRAASARAR